MSKGNKTIAPDGWARTVTVEWLDPTDLSTVSVVETGMKRIKVAITYNSNPVSELVAIRTHAWPEEEELPPGGNPPHILFLVGVKEQITPQEQARLDLMNTWGFVVVIENDHATSEEFNSLASTIDVVYISVEVNETQLDPSMRNVAVGLVNEEPDLNAEIGFASNYRTRSKKHILVDDNTHFITSEFELGLMSISPSIQPLTSLRGFGSPDLQILTYTNTNGPNYYPSLTFLDAGATLYGGGTAAARRVMLPWGDEGYDINSLNPAGRKLLLRSILWAAGREDYQAPTIPYQGGGSESEGGPSGGGPN